MSVVLIVDNDKNQRLLYEHELGCEDYERITAANGKETLGKVQWLDSDIIIMDINIPMMDGLEEIGKIIGKNKKKTPIIIHTSYSHYKDCFMSWNEDSYVIKSSDLTELKITINNLLAKKTIVL
ncbi:MAG: response regulator [Candidatus Scalindua sp.]|nr:response regulator [Candidatus Scalindua sp.]